MPYMYMYSYMYVYNVHAHTKTVKSFGALLMAPLGDRSLDMCSRVTPVTTISSFNCKVICVQVYRSSTLKLCLVNYDTCHTEVHRT